MFIVFLVDFKKKRKNKKETKLFFFSFLKANSSFWVAKRLSVNFLLLKNKRKVFFWLDPKVTNIWAFTFCCFFKVVQILKLLFRPTLDRRFREITVSK